MLFFRKPLHSKSSEFAHQLSVIVPVVVNCVQTGLTPGSDINRKIVDEN